MKGKIPPMIPQMKAVLRRAPGFPVFQKVYWGAIYRVLFFRRDYLKMGVFASESQLWMASLTPYKKIDLVLSALKPSTVLDLGCGTGKSLDYILSHGVEVWGVEGSRKAIAKARHPERITRYNLNNELNLGRKFDLVWSFEFVEHIHPDYVHNLIRSFSNHSDTVVLSAAHPGQGGDGHYNEQPAEYWIEKFGEARYRFDAALTAPLRATVEDHSENMLIFRR